MEREEKNQIKSEPEFMLQWGKRLRCVRVKNPNFSSKSGGGIRQKITSRIVSDSDPSFSPLKNTRINRSSEPPGNLKSPEKEERYYLTRGASVGDERENGKAAVMAEGNGFTVAAAAAQDKGSLLVSPGAWLSDMCQERYEVREKKTPKKRPRGLKAMGMGTMDSDSE